jgi:hypothetical protein
MFGFASAPNEGRTGILFGWNLFPNSTSLFHFVNPELNKLEKFLIYLVTCNTSELCSVADFGKKHALLGSVDQTQYMVVL